MSGDDIGVAELINAAELRHGAFFGNSASKKELMAQVWLAPRMATLAERCHNMR